MYAKPLGIVLGALAILGSIMFGFLALVGYGLSKAWDTGNGYSTAESVQAIAVFFLLLLIGLVTLIGALKLKNMAWAAFYRGFCFTVGALAIVMCFISLGAWGIKSGLFMLGIGILYLLLGYWVKDNSVR